MFSYQETGIMNYTDDRTPVKVTFDERRDPATKRIVFTLTVIAAK